MIGKAEKGRLAAPILAAAALFILLVDSGHSARAGWQVCFSGPVPELQGCREYFACYQQCEAARQSQPFPEQIRNSQCVGNDDPVCGGQPPEGGGNGGDSGPQFDQATLDLANKMIRHNSEGRRLYAAGECTAAVKQYQVAIGELSQLTATTRHFDWSVTTQGVRQRLAQAEACSRKQQARQKEEENKKLAYKLNEDANASWKACDVVTAIDKYRRAHELSPSDAVISKNLENATSNLTETTKLRSIPSEYDFPSLLQEPGCDVLDKLIELYPKKFPALVANEAGIALFNKGEFAAAIAKFDEALKLAKADSEVVRDNLAKAQSAQKAQQARASSGGEGKPSTSGLGSPVPPLPEQPSWSTNPSDATHAAGFVVDTRAFARALEMGKTGRNALGEWITDQIKEQGKDIAIKTVMTQLHVSEIFQSEAASEISMMEEARERSQQMNQDVETTVESIYVLAGDVATCVGGGTNCSAAQYQQERLPFQIRGMSVGWLKDWLIDTEASATKEGALELSGINDEKQKLLDWINERIESARDTHRPGEP